MMKTYADVLKEREQNMAADYNRDETARQELRIQAVRKAQGTVDTVKLGKGEEPWTAIDVEIRDEDFIRIAHAAHTRDITINKMVNIILKDSLKTLEYKFEHQDKPQFLTENN